MNDLHAAASAPATAPPPTPLVTAGLSKEFRIVPPLSDYHQITHDDISFILKNELRPESHRDPRILAFIGSYVVCRDVRQAGAESGVGFAVAKAFMNRKDIHAAIAKITESAAMKYGLDPSEIVERVKEIAYLDPATIFRSDGTCIENMHDIPAESRRAIKKFKVKNLFETDANGMPVVVGRLVEVELWDKLKSNELLGREKHLFTETTVVQHDITKNMASSLLESKERADARAIARRNEMIDVTPDKGSK